MATPTTKKQQGALIGDLRDQGKDIATISKETGIDEASVNRSLGALTSKDLEGQKPIGPAPIKPTTGAAGFQGELEQRTADYTADLARKSEIAEGDRIAARDQYLGSLQATPGEVELTSQAYGQKGGVDELEAEASRYTQDIRAEQHSLRRKLETLDKNPGGLFGGALQDEKDRITRESLKSQADLTILQMGAQGRYDSAKAIADRAVAVQLERQKNVNEALKLQYQDNKDLFDKAEQRAFESAQADRERTLKKQEEDLNRIYELAITAGKNDAPLSLVETILSSKDRNAALQAAQPYLENPLDRQYKQAQIAKMNQEISEAQAGGSAGIFISEKGEPTTGTQPPKAPAEGEKNAFLFFNRMKDAVDALDSVEGEITKMGLKGQVSLKLPSFLQGANTQVYKQAQRQFTEARLRKDSGAAIPPEEFKNDAKTYFPQPGDTPEVLARKADARKETLAALRLASGNAYWETFGESPVSVYAREQVDKLPANDGGDDPLGLFK